MSTVPARRPGSRPRLVLRDIDWKTYTRLVWVFAERPQVRLTYDRGVLEIMSPLIEHGRHRSGLEPDRCYWMASEPAVRGKKRLDLRVDPPPDLAIEVDVTSSSLDRMKIYAALGVPEV